MTSTHRTTSVTSEIALIMRFSVAVRSATARLGLVAVLERSADYRLHYHCIIDRPYYCSFGKFDATVREQWIKTDFGYRQVDIQDHSDAGWTDYILRQRQKRSLFDSIDWANCQLIAE